MGIKEKLGEQFLKLIKEVLLPFLKSMVVVFVEEILGDVVRVLQEKMKSFFMKKETGMTNLIILAESNIEDLLSKASESEKKASSILTRSGFIIKRENKILTNEKLALHIEAEKNKAKAEVWEQILDELMKQKGLLDKEQKELINEFENIEKKAVIRAGELKEEDVEIAINNDKRMKDIFDSSFEAAPTME